jgi:superfamily II DNA helicase RecQ
MRQYAERAACRMLQLVAHFGDQHDGGEPCGLCDVCAPAAAVVQRFRAAAPDEVATGARILAALRERDGRTTGQLHRDVLAEAIDRRALDGLLGALARAGAVRLVGEVFVKDGREVPFQRVFLVDDRRAAAGDLRMVEAPTVVAASKRPRRSRGTPARGQPALTAEASPLRDALRGWRAQEGQVRKVPSFRILTDRTLLGIVAARPRSLAELLRVPGIGEATLARHGAAILAVVAAPPGGGALRGDGGRGVGGDPRASAAREGGARQAAKARRPRKARRR